MKYLYYCFFIMTIFISTAIAATNELNVAVFIEPPYVDLIDNELVGENIDIITLLANSLQLKPVFLQCPPVRCLTMIRQGQADLMMGLSKLPERETDLIFLNPPYLVQQQPLRFFTLKEKNLTISKFSDLEDLLVGVLRGAAYFDRFDTNQSIKKVDVTSREQLVNMLLKGRIDTFLEREESVLPLLSEAKYQTKLVKADYQYNKPIDSYVALSKHSNAKIYAEQLSTTLAKAVADGTIQKIQKANRDKLQAVNIGQ